MSFSMLQRSTKLTWEVKRSFAHHIYFFRIVKRGFGEDCTYISTKFFPKMLVISLWKNSHITQNMLIDKFCISY